jgi:hypothetical protein
MDLYQLISSTLGLSPPWEVSRVIFAGDGNRLDITVGYDPNASRVCPCCGARGTPCREASETWYHPDFLRYATYLHTQVPQMICCGRHRSEERPWARTGSKFIRLDSDEVEPEQKA